MRLEPVLRPAWWVIRAYLAVSLLTAVERDGSFPGFPAPRLAGSPVLGLLAVVAAVPLSVRLGQRRLPRAGRLALQPEAKSFRPSSPVPPPVTTPVRPPAVVVPRLAPTTTTTPAG